MKKAITSSRSLPTIRAVIVFALLAGFLGLTLFKAEVMRSSGVEITLETRPIDPRDLFFGHYATLGYVVQAQEVRPYTSEATFQALSPSGEDKSLRRDAYVALIRKGRFHEIGLLTLDIEEAAAMGVVQKVRTYASRNRRCKDDLKENGVCPAKLSIQFDLPRRYYADEETALTLQDKARAAGNQAGAERRYERCLERRAKALENTQTANVPDCKKPQTNNAADIRFGVILSVSEKGEAVIKGVEFDNQRVIDSLKGPRLSLVRENSGEIN